MQGSGPIFGAPEVLPIIVMNSLDDGRASLSRCDRAQGDVSTLPSTELVVRPVSDVIEMPTPVARRKPCLQPCCRTSAA